MIDEKTVITCRHCGASIEIDDKHPCPILAAHDFKVMHKPCRAIDADFMPSTIRQAYSELLKMPMGSERIRLDGTLARLRDAIANAEGRDAEDVQNEYESKTAASTIRARMPRCKKCGSLRLVGRVVPHIAADPSIAKGVVRCSDCGHEEPSDPYARFRDAIRDGKRVFVELDGRMHVAHQHFGEMYKDSPSNYFIEGVDIPVKPTQVELDKYGLELTGVCKLLQKGDVYWTIDGTPCFGPAVLNYNGSEGFSGRRWIVQPKAKLCANCGGIIADGNTVYKKGMVLCACRPCPICHTLTAGLGERQICAKCKGGPLTPRDPTDSEIATHASENDAIVRKLLMQAIKQSLPSHVSQDFRGQIFMKGDCVVFSGYANATTPFCVQIECQHSRPVNLHIGQSATEIVKQARDLVQGMNITKKTKYVAFNIAGSELIWGIK